MWADFHDRLPVRCLLGCCRQNFRFSWSTVSFALPESRKVRKTPVLAITDTGEFIENQELFDWIGEQGKWLGIRPESD